MKTYYKATRPDGFDFYSATVDYAGHLGSGKPLPHKSTGPGYFACCSSTVYHASDIPSETLIGGAWPCRLFEVTGRPVATEGHKFGFRSLRVVKEIEAWRALGPNGEAVVALIEEIGNWTEPQSSAAWDATRGAAWDVARDAAFSAARDAAYTATRGAAWDVARAAGMLTVKDLIEQRRFDALFVPIVAAREAA